MYMVQHTLWKKSIVPCTLWKNREQNSTVMKQGSLLARSTTKVLILKCIICFCSHDDYCRKSVLSHNMKKHTLFFLAQISVL